MRSNGFRHVLAAATLATLAAGAASAQPAGTIAVTVAGLRSDAGSVRCALYNSADGFREPGREFRGVTAPIKGGQASCSFAGIPAGIYAVALFHAERNETRIEYGAFGRPKQGYGFSNNPSTTFGAPGFSAAAFRYAGSSQRLSVRLQY